MYPLLHFVARVANEYSFQSKYLFETIISTVIKEKTDEQLTYTAPHSYIRLPT